MPRITVKETKEAMCAIAGERLEALKAQIHLDGAETIKLLR